MCESVHIYSPTLGLTVVHMCWTPNIKCMMEEGARAHAFKCHQDNAPHLESDGCAGTQNAHTCTGKGGFKGPVGEGGLGKNNQLLGQEAGLKIRRISLPSLTTGSHWFTLVKGCESNRHAGVSGGGGIRRTCTLSQPKQAPATCSLCQVTCLN